MNIQRLFEIEQNIDISQEIKSSLDFKIHSIKIGDYNDKDDVDYVPNTVYKFRVINSTPQRLDNLTAQMKLRLIEGQGQCIYEIGVEENGNTLGLSEEELKISIATLTDIAYKLNAKISCHNFLKGKVGIIAEVLIKQSVINANQLEIKIGLIGQENSGKSTLVMSHIILDRSFSAR